MGSSVKRAKPSKQGKYERKSRPPLDIYEPPGKKLTQDMIPLCTMCDFSWVRYVAIYIGLFLQEDRAGSEDTHVSANRKFGRGLRSSVAKASELSLDQEAEDQGL